MASGYHRPIGSRRRGTRDFRFSNSASQKGFSGNRSAVEGDWEDLIERWNRERSKLRHVDQASGGSENRGNAFFTAS
jgi:hypothetical protein